MKCSICGESFYYNDVAFINNDQMAHVMCAVESERRQKEIFLEALEKTIKKLDKCGIIEPNTPSRISWRFAREAIAKGFKGKFEIVD